ncbi:MAG: arylsulfatase, partial [Cyclobacteriaceae bacterium]
MILLNQLLIFLGCSAILLSSCTSNQEDHTEQISTSEGPPNVILVITDDQGYGEIGAHQNPRIRTPNLDALHANSIRLTDFHVSPTCSPTRAALMTGHYSNRTGVWHTIAGRSQIRQNEVTMAEVFLQNGYSTSIFGKWHLGDNYPFRPQDKGFQEVLVHGGGGVTQQPDYWGNDYFDDTYFHNGQPEKFEGYCTDVWFDNAIQFIEEKKDSDSPFFCYIGTNAPHGPFLVEDKYRENYEGDSSVVNPAFYGMIENIDYNMGRLLDYLDQSGLQENTLVIFMSDNGTAAGANMNELQEVIEGYNAGMRGKKNSAYEGTHRVPFYMYWPAGGLDKGQDINTLTAHIDVLPTLIDLLELNGKPELQFDGQSIVKEIFGSGNLEGQRTLVTDSQRKETPEKWRKSCTMRGKWRLINGKELYNVEDDPGQKNDLAADRPQLVADLRGEYEKWWEDLLPTFNDIPKTILGSEQEPTTILYIHDMHLKEEYSTTLPWNQYQTRKNDIKSMGWWAVDVAEAGSYQMTFYRWPSHLQVPITSPLEG